MPFDPAIIEARLALNLIAAADWPRLACDALESGLDGAGIRRLAALIQPTWSEVAVVLPEAMREMKLVSVLSDEAGLRLAKQWAREILQSGSDPLTRTREFEQLYIQAGYPKNLSRFGALDDEVSVARQMGHSKEEIRRWLLQELNHLVKE